MDDTERQRYAAQSTDIRVQLKQWENDFAKDHHGKKPGRDDIKGNPEIGMSLFAVFPSRHASSNCILITSCTAQLYKTYNKVRDMLAGKIPPPPPPQPKADKTSRKRKSPEPPSQSPSKRRFGPDQTPSRLHVYSQTGENAVTPSLNRKLFSPAVPTSIGPTPQRDGRVLGLFDALPFKNVDETPTKPADKRSINDTNVVGTIQATPCKSAKFTSPESAVKPRRTPMSSTKRNILNEFMTPLKKRDCNIGSKTPSGTISRLQFDTDTPAFLRRAPMPSVDENSAFISPEPIRLPRKSLVRGLSSVVADLRKLQEDELDDDLDALREMENEGAPSNRATVTSSKPESQPQTKDDNVLVEDSQLRNLPLGGFDDEGMYDSQAENEGLGRDGQPLRVYKKKGQKRTTRRVNMRPVRSKRPSEAADDAQNSDSEGEDVVPETQLGASKQDLDEDDELALDLSGSDFDGSDAEDDAPKKTKRKAGKKAAKKTAKEQVEKEGKVKKVARKVNELAHANFKRLKLRNNGAKGGAGYNSKFRRRR